MIVEQSREIIEEVNKAFIGKNNIIEKVLMTIYCGWTCPSGRLSRCRQNNPGPGVCQGSGTE